MCVQKILLPRSVFLRIYDGLCSQPMSSPLRVTNSKEVKPSCRIKWNQDAIKNANAAHYKISRKISLALLTSFIFSTLHLFSLSWDEIDILHLKGGKQRDSFFFNEQLVVFIFSLQLELSRTQSDGPILLFRSSTWGEWDADTDKNY